MSDKDNHNNDLPDWLKDFEPEGKDDGKNQDKSGQENLSNDDWLSSLNDELEKEKADPELTEEEKELFAKDRKIDSTQEFLYEIENMIDDRSYLNLGDRTEHVADGNEWTGWHSDSSNDDNDEWLSSLSLGPDLGGKEELPEEPISAFSEDILVEDDPLPVVGEEQQAINLDETPDWLKEATVEENNTSIKDEYTENFLNDLSSDAAISENEPVKEQNAFEADAFDEEESQALEDFFDGLAPIDSADNSNDAVEKVEEDAFSIAPNTGKQKDLPDWLQDASDENSQESNTLSQSSNSAFELSDSEEDILSDDDKSLSTDGLPEWLKVDMDEESQETASTTKESNPFAGVDASAAQDTIPAGTQQSPFMQEDAPPKEPKLSTGSLSDELEEEAYSVLDSLPAISDDDLEDMDLFDADIDLSEENDSKNNNEPFSQNTPSLDRSQMPEWMKAIRPSDAKEESREEIIASQPEVKIGPLAGLRGVIPAEPEVVSFSNPSNPEGSLQVTAQQSAFATLMEDLFDGTAETPTPKHEKTSFRNRGWLLIPLLLIVALLAANFVNIPQINAPLTPANQAFADTITSLPAEANVLVVLDYQLGVYRELHTGLNNLMIELNEVNANVYTITTQPMGNGLANMLVQDYPSVTILPLGYLTGNASAISQFAYDLSIAPNASLLPITLRQMNHFDAVLLITDGVDNLQNWAEQAGPALPDAPLLVLSSAKIKPIVAAYYQTSPQRVDGYLSGYFESITYQKYLLPQLPQDTETWDAIYLVTIMVIVLLMIGSTVSLMGNLLEGLRKERKAKK